MPNLEKYIKDHLDEFDSQEPDPNHFRKFEDRLKAGAAMKPVPRNRSLMLRVAAIIVILISLSVFLFDFATREIRQKFARDGQGTELPAEIREAVQYYNNQTNTQIATIHKLAATRNDGSTVSESALLEVKNIDSKTKELRESLAGNPGNEHILDAIIRNQQMKEAMLNTIIEQLSLYKK
jgi:ABC-type Na+ efflux pump permease subunit